MTIQLELDPSLEKEVKKAAELRELPLAEYVKSFLQEHHHNGAIRLPKGTLSVKEFLDAMAYHGPVSGQMRSQVIDRAFIYGDHP